MAEVSIRTLDLGLLQAGASMKGEFENRLKQVIEEVQASEKPIILFIDEAHTLDRRGRRSRYGRCRQPAQTRLGTRHFADDSGNHLGGIQKAF